MVMLGVLVVYLFSCVVFRLVLVMLLGLFSCTSIFVTGVGNGVGCIFWGDYGVWCC